MSGRGSAPSSGTTDSVWASGPQHVSLPATASTVTTSCGPAHPSTRPGPVRSSDSGSGTDPPRPVGSTKPMPVGTPGASTPGGALTGSTVVTASSRPSGDQAAGPASTPSTSR